MATDTLSTDWEVTLIAGQAGQRGFHMASPHAPDAEGTRTLFEKWSAGGARVGKSFKVTRASTVRKALALIFEPRPERSMFSNVFAHAMAHVPQPPAAPIRKRSHSFADVVADLRARGRA